MALNVGEASGGGKLRHGRAWGVLSTLTPLWVPRVQSHPTKESSPPQAVTPPPPSPFWVCPCPHGCPRCHRGPTDPVDW